MMFLGAGEIGYYYTKDHLGSVREMLNSSGSIVARYAYDPNGVTALVSGTDISTFGFAGMQKHPASGLYMTLWRIYNAWLAIWYSRDRMGEGVDTTLYSYVYNDPTDYVDRLGLQADTPQESLAILQVEAELEGKTVAQIIAERAAQKAAQEAADKAAKLAAAALAAKALEDAAAAKKLKCKIIAVVQDMHSTIEIYQCNDGTWYRRSTCVPGNVGDVDSNPPPMRQTGAPVIPDPYVPGGPDPHKL